MKCFKTFFLGIFAAAIFGGLWWLVLISGVFALITQRSYAVLVVGVLLDLWFTTLGESQFFGGFYTILFIVVTLIVEYVRSRLLWAS